MSHLFQACSCGAMHITRIHRSVWMRLLPGLRLYRCESCGRRQLRNERAVDIARSLEPSEASDASDAARGRHASRSPPVG
jgi:hypothetical protein